MELYISDHPLDCLTCSANGDCELQDMAGAVGLREVRYGYDGANHPESGEGRIQPLFHLRPLQVHRLLPLRARLRRGAGHLRADDRRPRFRSRRVAGQEEPFFGSECVSCGACVQACPTATLIEKSVIEIGQPEHSVVTTCAYCGVGCCFQGRDARRRAGAHGPVQGRQGQSRPLLRQGPLRLGLRHPPGADPQADDPRQDHRPLARRSAGTRRSATPLRVQAHPGASTAACRGRHHLLALHQRGDLSGAEAGPRRLRQQQRRHLRARLPFADRLRLEHDLRDLGRHAGLRFVEHADV